MSYKFEMSNVTESLTQLYRYVSETVHENAWKSDPVISDSPMGTSIKFPHPNSAIKDVKAKSEPFSSICIHLSKPYVPQLNFEVAYDSKKAAARFSDMLQGWNKNICDEFFAMLLKLDDFSFKLQVTTIFKKTSLAKKHEHVFIAPATSVSYDDVVENFKKVIELCNSTDMVKDDKEVKSRVARISISRDFSIDDLSVENSPFDNMIKTLHKFMLLEPKILSEKDAKKPAKVQKKIGEKDKFYTILSNRAGEEFYCRLTNAEFQKKTEFFGIQVWNKESLEEKKYIRAALKLVSEL